MNDAISGASPNGLTPPSQWPIADYQTAFANQYAAQFSAFTNNNPFDGSSTYTEYLDFINSHFGASITNLAAAAANANNFFGIQSNNIASSGLLSNHPNKVPVTQIVDHRMAYSIGVPLTFGIHTITPQYSDSREHDYRSHGGSLNYSVQLNKKNTTLNLGWSHNSDRVRDPADINADPANPATQPWKAKISDDFFIGVNQLLSPKSYCTINFTYGNEYGLLNDPYRRIIVYPATGGIDLSGVSAPDWGPNAVGAEYDTRPRKRNKQIVYLSYARFFEKANGSADVSYRFFRDSFGILSQTVDMSWHQKIGKYLVFTPSFRFYYQTAADFYRTYLVAPYPQYYSADYRLSELNSYSLGANLTIRVHKYASLDIGYQRYVMQGLDSVTSQSAYPSAHTVTFGGRAWF